MPTLRFDLTTNARRRLCPIAAGILTAALLGTLAAALANADVSYRVGLLVVVTAATCLVTLRTGIGARMIEKARQDGYDDGYRDGLGVTPAPVIRIVGDSRGGAFPLPQRRATQKLG